MQFKFLKSPAFWIFTVLVLVVGGYAYIFEELPKEEVKTKQTTQLAALLTPLPEPIVLDERTKEADCQIQGSLPDHECSPGAVFKDATQEIICVSGYTKTVRNVSVSLKKKVFAEYGIAYPVPFGSYEVDHIVPLALGGNNDIANLFPEARQPYPGFQEKDVVENYLHEHVCSGEIDLAAAQVQIANDWLGVYNNLSEETIKAYKAKYKSWAPES